jgi:hypothetical protein
MLNPRYHHARFLATVCALALAGLFGTVASASAAPSVLSPSPVSWNFGNVGAHGGGGPSQTFTFTNNTGGLVSVLGPTVVGADPTDFQLSFNTCSGAFLLPSPSPISSCGVQVTFNPGSAGAKSASLELTDSSGTLDVPLSGTGIPGTLTASPNPLNFPPQPYFNGGQQQGINIQNSNDAGTQATSATITGPDASRFYIAGGQNCITQQYGPGSLCGMNVGFNPPNGPGSFHAQLELTSDSASSPLIIPLNATALNGPHAVISPSQTDFGNVAIGHSASQTITVSNDGDAPMQVQQPFMVTGTPSVFPITADGCSGQVVNQGSFCQFTVRFQPSAAGYREGSVITIINDASGPITPIGFTGTGVPSPQGAATITGNAAAGSKLTCNPVSYPAGTSYAYQWLRNGETLTGATAAGSTPGDGDVGSQLSCRLTASNPVGIQTVTSPSTGPIAAMNLSRIPGSFVDTGTCRAVNAARQLQPGGTLVTLSYPQPSVPWAPLTVAARQTLHVSIDRQTVGSGRRVSISPRTLAAYTDGAHTLRVTTHGHTAQTPLLLAPCSLAIRVDGGPGQGALISLAARVPMKSATITLPRGLDLHLTARKLGQFTYTEAGYPSRTFDIIGARTTSNNVTVVVTRHTIKLSNLPARTGVIRFSTRTGVLAGNGGTVKATAALAGALRDQTSNVPATWQR